VKNLGVLKREILRYAQNDNKLSFDYSLVSDYLRG